ncbi:hypothetical protein F53441_6729 [Fusarium austroafricanum]|uniref:Uncharacterized protein n=1 Tax=Fusarium austroafricanum TaxID=2364996 RepID=A0A8H4KEZ8_9HYPO|nr:hypothetical protein F53441_6729 [Fusarium austroafricanum]
MSPLASKQQYGNGAIISKDKADENYHQGLTYRYNKKLTDERLSNRAGLFGTPQDVPTLLGIPNFRLPPAGHIYRCSEDECILNNQCHAGKVKDIKRRYEDLWSSTQFFWDTMLRMQPNRYTSNADLTRQAVDFVLDFMVGGMLPDVKEDFDPQIADVQLQILNRRLQVLQLRLREDMFRVPDTLCVCTVPHKWSKKLQNWKRTQQADRGFKLRDIAGLQRLEDFLAREFKHHNNPINPNDQRSVLNTAILLMDDEVKRFLPQTGYLTVKELKTEWVYVLCHPGFRNRVVLEVTNLVNDASELHKNGTGHRKGCNFGTAPESASSSKPKSLRGLKLAFWRKDLEE